MAEKKSGSSTPKWVAILLTGIGAVFGTSRLNGPGSESLSDKKPRETIVAMRSVASEDEKHHVHRMRAPLRDFLGLMPAGSDAAQKSPMPWGPKDDPWVLPNCLKDSMEDYDLEFLVITVADPIDSTNDYFFDQQLDSLLKALATDPSDQWLYTDAYLPWQAFKDRRKKHEDIALQRKNHWYQDEPGVLLFRKAEKSRKSLLLVFLVGELSTFGIQRDALDHAIHEIAILTKETNNRRDGNLQAANKPPLVVPIIGPTFSGSAFSLSEGLKHSRKHLEQIRHKGQKVVLRIINPSATAIDSRLFDEFEYLGATVATSDATVRAIRNFTFGHKTVWLSETSTAFGSKFLQDHDTGNDVIHIPYPVGISRVRSNFEQQLTTARAQTIGMPLINSTSPLPFDPDDTARDVPTMQTPQMTSPSIELKLQEIMRLVNSWDARFVCIVATDIRDTIFLSEMLKLRCPRIQLIVMESDILLTHPSYTDSLRGAIVARSYPQFAEGMLACKRANTLPLMGGKNEYGIFNAILLQRALYREVKGLTFTRSQSALVTVHRFNIACEPRPDDFFTGEYMAGLITNDNGVMEPSVWLHTVGYDRFYPLKVCPGHVDDVSTKNKSTRMEIKSNVRARTIFYFQFDRSWIPAIVGLVILCIAILFSGSDWFAPLHVCPTSGAAMWYNCRRIVYATLLVVCAYSFYYISISFDYICESIQLSNMFVLADLAEAHFFSGVTLLLPLYCACAAVGSMCYLKLRQSYIVSDGRTKDRGASESQQAVYQVLWSAFNRRGRQAQGCGSVHPARRIVGKRSTKRRLLLQLAASIVPRSSWHFVRAFQKMSPSVRTLLIVCLGGLAWRLFFAFWDTIDVSQKPLMFVCTWCFIAGGYVIWWLAIIELYVFVQRLRDSVRGYYGMGNDPLDSILVKFRGEEGCVYRILFGAGPTPNDVVMEVAKGNPTRGNDRTLIAFREVQYRFLIIKHQIYLLAFGALLLFAAVVSYPFTSAAMWRLMSITTILTLAGSVCYCFWKLEVDKHISTLLGTTPNEFDWDWQNISVFASSGAMAILVLLAQFVPGSWSWVASVVGPLLHHGG